MIFKGNEEIVGIFKGNKVFTAIHRGTTLIWQGIRSCFGAGHWVNEKPWRNEEGWKNN